MGNANIKVERCTGSGYATPPPVSGANSNRNQDLAPNPVLYSTALNLSDYAIEQARIRIFDNTGRPVTAEEHIPDGAHTHTLDCSKLPTGTYFIVLYLLDGTHVFKAIKISL